MDTANNRTTTYLIKLTISSLLLLAMIFLAWQTFSLSRENRIHQMYLHEMDGIQYGLFNAHTWANKISRAVESRIDNMDFSKEDRIHVQQIVLEILDEMTLAVDRYFENETRPGDDLVDNIFNIIRESLRDAIFDLDEIRNTTLPKLSNEIMNELEKPENKAQLKRILKEKLAIYVQQRFGEAQPSLVIRSEKYPCHSDDECKTYLTELIDNNSSQEKYYVVALIVLAVFIFILQVFERTLLREQLLVLSLCLLILLGLGVSLPMLSILASIEAFSLDFLGETVMFGRQVLFHRSESVTDVFHLLIQDGRSELVLVAVLLLTFSLIFPLCKLIASWLFYTDYKGLRGKGVVKFFALKSGKWSMADVMVISIFMAFLGLRGFVAGKLGSLEQAVENYSENASILTMNGTNLQSGFFLFLAFVILSLVLSMQLEKQPTQAGK